MKNNVPKNLTYWRFLPAIVLVGCWETAAENSSSVKFFYGMPSQIIKSLAVDFWSRGLWYDIIITFSEAFLGFTIGSLGGLLISVLISLSPVANYIMRPYFIFLGAVPIVAIAPLMILWFGAGFPASLAVATLSTILLSIGQVQEGLASALSEWSRLAHSFRASKWRLYRYIVLPGAATWVFSSWRAAIGLALVGAFVGEFISADRGLGRYILKASALYDASRVLGGVAVIGFVAIGLTYLLTLAERWFMPWRRPPRQRRLQSK